MKSSQPQTTLNMALLIHHYSSLHVTLSTALFVCLWVFLSCKMSLFNTYQYVASQLDTILLINYWVLAIKGNKQLQSIFIGVVNTMDLKHLVFEGVVPSSRLPLGWGWRFGHDHCIPVIRDLWQTRGRGLLPGLREAIHTNTQQSIKKNIPRLKNVIWSLESFPKREKVQSKFPLWKMKKLLPTKKYYQGMSLIDWRQKE